MAIYYTTKLWWLTSNTLESNKLTYDEAMSEFHKLCKHPAVKKVIVNKYTVSVKPMIKHYKRSGGKNMCGLR